MDNKQAAGRFAALGHETRVAIYRLLVQAGPTGVAAGEIGASLKVPAATVSFHLRELSHAGLVTSAQRSRYVFYSANFDGMNELLRFLTENCCVADGTACAPICASPSPAVRPADVKAS